MITDIANIATTAEQKLDNQFLSIADLIIDSYLESQKKKKTQVKIDQKTINCYHANELK